MRLWNGHIDFDDEHPQIQDLHLSHPNATLPSLRQNTSFRFLAIVETANVPLYLAAGPSLDVWTTNERTEVWLHTCFAESLRNEETGGLESWWERSGGQSEHAVLLGVDGGYIGQGGPGPEITQILLYAAATNTPQDGHAPPSLPASPSLVNDFQAHKVESSLRLYALPLSNKIYNTLDQVPINPQRSPQDFYYIPSPPSASTHPAEIPPPKRPRIESLFEDATENRRLQKKRGGEGIAKAMAAMDNRMAIPALPSAKQTEPIQAKKNIKSMTQSPLARATTTGSINPPLSANHSGPEPAQESRRSTMTIGRRSSLHHVSSALSPSLSSDLPTAANETVNNNDIESQNKTSLSRIIMAGMRMYGFQPQRKKSIGNLDTQSQLSGICSSGAAGGNNEDEYKTIYHQTFKASSFAFRHHWTKRILGPEMLRDTVDVFLGKFCQDPLSARGCSDEMPVGAIGSQE
ncbi:MAG: hypothetical protein Q9186_006210 [Xanthomendoza sp. 1 TL-2023]